MVREPTLEEKEDNDVRGFIKTLLETPTQDLLNIRKRLVKEKVFVEGRVVEEKTLIKMIDHSLSIRGITP